ncbi:MAG: hypothetical protein HOV79_04295 [Hamadaea sp.]|nr:hypothetical protein [Hamadaea sp.]
MSEAPAKTSWLVGPILLGGLLSVAMGVYGVGHKGKSVVLGVSGFENLARVKAWLAAAVAVLVVVQLLTALIMYGKLRVASSSWVGPVHRWSGRLAFFTAVVIGVYCLYGVGFQYHNLRAAVHSTAGCLFFGGFVIKMLVLTKPGLKGWILPVAGGTVFTLLATAIATSAGWYVLTGGPH